MKNAEYVKSWIHTELNIIGKFHLQAQRRWNQIKL
jgi:hypothetical protein